jgi:hypothetical protein
VHDDSLQHADDDCHSDEEQHQEHHDVEKLAVLPQLVQLADYYRLSVLLPVDHDSHA